MGKYRKFQEGKLGWPWMVAVGIVKPVLLATTTHEWEGGEKIPASGGAVIALNHVSEIDPFTAAHIVWDYGRRPSYLAKAGLFRGALGKYLRAAGQIPVDRSAGSASFDEAVKAVNEGSIVVVYVEGSITKDPGGWPMRGKSGAARIALATGAPVYPVGQWGAQELLPAYSLKPHLLGRKTIQMKIGDPVDLKDLEVQDHTVAVVGEATDRIMNAIVGLVAEIRQEEPPSELFDPKKAGVNETGNPNQQHKKRNQKDSN